MKINYENKYIINDIYVHDSIFEGFTYKEDEKEVLIEMRNYFLKKTFKIKFCNTIVLNCEMCQFWGRSDNILNWEIDNVQSFLKDVIKKQKENEKLYEFSLLSKGKKYIESRFIQSSGDVITIVCEYIEFQEEEFQKNT